MKFFFYVVFKINVNRANDISLLILLFFCCFFCFCHVQILNLQEVQFDHFQDFILPMLKKLGTVSLIKCLKIF